jgi:putative ABC transport system ATP-binding protein
VSLAYVRDLWKVYHIGHIEVPALRGVSLTFSAGDYVAIMGPSGSGKSTLLNLLGCLDRPSSGEYVLGDEDVSTLSDDALSEIRSRRLGFIFQSYNLIPQLTVIENIEVPLFYQGVPRHERYEIARQFAERVGLSDRLHHRPMELSGGQQQRVAIARALVNDPLLILADEPTGNLDSQTQLEILDLLDELNRGGKTIAMVTHEHDVAARAHRTIHLRDGHIVDGAEPAWPPAGGS